MTTALKPQVVAGRRHARVSSRLPVVVLVGIGCLLELALLLRLVRPFSLMRLSGPQLAPEPLTEALPQSGHGLGEFLLTLGLRFAGYYTALVLAPRVDRRTLLVVAPFFSMLFALTLWPTIALGSTDLYHYILDGRALALHGVNPLATPPQDSWNDPLSSILYYNRENTGAYGPLFYLLAAGAALLGHGDLVWSTLAMKGLAVVALLGCLPLVYRLAERVHGGAGGLALVAFAWNPLLLFEVAGSGHNDIGVAFFGLLGVWLAVIGRWWWAPAALALGVLIKPTAVLLVPALGVWLWFQPRRPPLVHLTAAFCAAGALIVAWYIPMWAGAETFSQLRHLATLRMNSPVDALVVLLWTHLPGEPAIQVAKLSAGAAFLMCAALVLMRTRGGDPAELVRAAFWCLFAYLMLACWWFWPWYLVPLIALGAVLWPGRAGTVMAVFSCSAMVLYPVLGWRLLLFTYQTPYSQALGVALIVFLPPALVWVSGWWKAPAAADVC